jgi:pimeloyl-ACP methyl ester carboxylesterase
MVVDIGVKAYPPHHGTILQGLQSIDLGSLGTRGDAEEQLKAHISDFGTRQFLLKSLYRTDKENFGWRINIPVLDSKMPEILKAIPKESVDVPAMFVSGSKSDYVKAADHAAITKNFPHAQFVELPTGHWVHAEDPEGLEQLIRKFVTT